MTNPIMILVGVQVATNVLAITSLIASCSRFFRTAVARVFLWTASLLSALLFVLSFNLQGDFPDFFYALCRLPVFTGRRQRGYFLEQERCSMSRSAVPNAKTVWLFVIGFFLGGGALLRVFGIAFFASTGESFREAAIWWFAPAAVVSAVIAAFQPSIRLFWNLGFAAPIVCWCLLCTFYAFGDIRYLWWTSVGGITAVTAVAGALLGRVIGRSFISERSLPEGSPGKS